jgi:hypothetical protein
MDIYKHTHWPNLNWDKAKLLDLLAEVRPLQGRQ